MAAKRKTNIFGIFMIGGKAKKDKRCATGARRTAAQKRSSRRKKK